MLLSKPACLFAWIGLIAGMAARAPAAPAADRGKFILWAHGQRLGSDSFKVDAQGASQADVEVTAAGQTQKFLLNVKVKGGKLASIAANAGRGNAFMIEIFGTTAAVTAGNRTTGAKVPAGVLPFGNFTPHLMNNLLAAYDAKKGGKQSFHLIVAEALPPSGPAILSATLERKGTRPHTVKGATQNLDHYQLVLAAGQNTALDLTADSSRRLLMWSVPSQQYVAIREGYESLKPK